MLTRIVSVIALTLLLTPPSARGAAPGELDYPELLVAPRASERLELEARQEISRRWLNHLPIQVSALGTLVSAVLLSGHSDPRKDPDNRAALAGYAVGGGWLAATALLSSFYQPYAAGVGELASLPRKSQREQLIRERLAEEAVERPARLARRLTVLSVATQLFTSIYLVTNSTDGSLARVTSAVSAALAFTPLVFRYRWQHVANEQESYKKKIYAPLASAALFPEPVTGRAAPGVSLAFFF